MLAHPDDSAAGTECLQSPWRILSGAGTCTISDCGRCVMDGVRGVADQCTFEHVGAAQLERREWKLHSSYEYQREFKDDDGKDDDYLGMGLGYGDGYYEDDDDEVKDKFCLWDHLTVNSTDRYCGSANERTRMVNGSEVKYFDGISRKYWFPNQLQLNGTTKFNYTSTIRTPVKKKIKEWRFGSTHTDLCPEG